MIKLGLYGCGNRTKALLNALRHDSFYTVHALYDLNPASAQALSQRFGGKICNTEEELFREKDVDAFMISLNPLAHKEVLAKVIPFGKPIFIEKPVAFSGEEVRELADLADKYHVPVQVGFMRRYLPSTLSALEYMKAHDPGKIYSIACNWFHTSLTETNFWTRKDPGNFRLQLSQIPYHTCHMLDIMCILGGPVREVNSLMIEETHREYPSPNDLMGNITFASGINGHFHYSSTSYYYEWTYRFHAENYSIKLCVEPYKDLEVFQKPRFITSQLGPDPDRKDHDFTSFNSYFHLHTRPYTVNYDTNNLMIADENIMYDFVRMVRDGVPPWADLRAAVRTQGLAEALERSGREKCTVKMDPDGVPLP